MRRGLVVSLLAILVIAGAMLGGTFAAGNAPSLGLDLQGGLSLVLAPTRNVDDGVLSTTIEILRNRVDAAGVAEPEISQQGDNILLQFPGVEEPQKLRDLVGQTAELRFRPVVGEPLPPLDDDSSTSTTTTTAAPDASTTTSTSAPETTTTTAATDTTATTAPPAEEAGEDADEAARAAGVSPPSEDTPERPVTLPQYDEDGKEIVARYPLGPATVTGKHVKSARAAFNQGDGTWYVEVNFNSEGSRLFDELASAYFERQVAIVLDGRIESAPRIEQREFGGKATITGDFTEREAKDLALVLRYGALPVELEEQNVQNVSATLGSDSLRAGLIAGFIGLGLVLLYLLMYYRALGLVVIIGLAVSGALLWSVVSFLGETSGLALSLAGVTGIIVSVGVTVDSYIVFFERLKDEIRSGKTVRSSVERGFSKAYRTILAADVASLIGAALLYFLTVGPVRGFAFFLGLSTALDLVVAYFFSRPAVALVSRSRFFTEARWFGVARGLAAKPAGGAG